MKDNRYGRTTRRGLGMDNWTAYLWDKLVKKFPRLVLTQGSPSGAAASGNTHAGQGAIDLYLNGHDRVAVLKYAFEIGFFGWYRPELWQNRRRVWKSHVHLGVRNHPFAHATLKAQQRSWTKLRNGLRGDGKDPFTWRPANYKKAAPYGVPPTPAKPSKPWYNARFLNMWGDDGAEGTRTFRDRLPKMVEDVTSGNPAVVGVCEVPADEAKRTHQEFAEQGYRLAGYSHRLGLYVRPGVQVKGVSFATYKKQNKGAIEGMLRSRLVIDGAKTSVNVTHLDYRKGFDAGRVTQMKQGLTSITRYLLAWILTGAKKRTVVMGDFNSEDWVMDQAMIPGGYKDAGCGADIDFICVGKERPVRGAGTTKTRSDHPIVWVKLGRY